MTNYIGKDFGPPVTEMSEFGTRRLVNVMESKPDLRRHVLFRGKPLTELTREELLDALDQALGEVYDLHQRLGRT